jgi:hypothetical protein
VALQLPYSESYRDQVALKFPLKNSPVDLGVPMGTQAPDDGAPDTNTLFSMVQHGTARPVTRSLAVKP